GPVIANNVVRVDDIAARFAHFETLRVNATRWIAAQAIYIADFFDFALIDLSRRRLGRVIFHLAENDPLVHQSRERLWRAHVAKIEEDFVPESRVQQMQYRMLRAADI